MALTMLVRDMAISDIPCPADTWGAFDVWLVEGLVLLVHLCLVGGRDGNGKFTLRPRSLSLLLLDALSES